MFRLQKTTKLEVMRISAGVLVGTGLMMLVFFLLDKWDLTVLYGGILGAIVAIFNFYFLAISVQRAVDSGEKSAQLMKSSYSLRMLVSALAIGLGLALDYFNPFAIVIPMLMPRATIYVLQFTGLYRPENKADSGKKGGE